MPECIDLDEILKANPQLSPESLEEYRMMLRRLRSRGTKSRGYNLAPPYGGKRASIQEESGEDKRTIRLRSVSQRS